MTPARTQREKDFENRFLDQLQESLGEVRDEQKHVSRQVSEVARKVDENTAETKGNGERLKKLEQVVYKSSPINPISPLFASRTILYMAMVCLLVFLLIIAAILGVEVPKALVP